jgi:hypothetical protein
MGTLNEDLFTMLLVYVILLITFVLLGTEHRMTPFGWKCWID